MRVSDLCNKTGANKLRFLENGIKLAVDDLDVFDLNCNDELARQDKIHSRIIDFYQSTNLRHKLCLRQDGPCEKNILLRHRGLSEKREEISGSDFSDYPILKRPYQRSDRKFLKAPMDGAFWSGHPIPQVPHQQELSS